MTLPTSKNMADHLNAVPPDVYETLSVSFYGELNEVGWKNQVVTPADDCNTSRRELCDKAVYELTADWNRISDADWDAMVDMYFNADKANRGMNSFILEHPDGNKYVALFAFGVTLDAFPVGQRFGDVRFIVLGNYYGDTWLDESETAILDEGEDEIYLESA